MPLACLYSKGAEEEERIYYSVNRQWPHSWVSQLSLYRHLRKDKFKKRESLMCYLMAWVEDCAKLLHSPWKAREDCHSFGGKSADLAELRKFPGNEVSSLITRRQCDLSEARKGYRTDPESYPLAEAIFGDVTQFHLLWNGKRFGGTWWRFLLQQFTSGKMPKYSLICLYYRQNFLPMNAYKL